MDFDPSADYPLGSKRPDLVATPSGIPLEEVTLEALRNGRIGDEEMRATGETVGRQAAVAHAAGRRQLAENLSRAAELAAIPSEEILRIYTALRPRRSTAAELDAWAKRLETEYRAPQTAALVREAKAVYELRDLLALEARERAETV